MIKIDDIKADLEEYAQDAFKKAYGRRGRLVVFSEEFLHDHAMKLNQIGMMGERRPLTEEEQAQMTEWASVYEQIKDLDIDALYKKVTFIDREGDDTYPTVNTQVSDLKTLNPEVSSPSWLTWLKQKLWR